MPLTLGRQIGVFTRLELPNQPPYTLFLQHRMDRGLALIRSTTTYVVAFTALLVAIALFGAYRLSRQLSRPIDAIRHQAKTVTVGTSRKERPPEGIVFDLLKTLAFDIATLTYRDIMMIRRIQPVIASIPGYTIYDISALDQQGNPTDDSLIAVRVKGGLAAGMKSRADKPAVLMGVKRTIVSTGHAYLGRGKTDNAPILIIPLRTQEAGIGNLLLLHVRFNEKLTLQEKIDALGYRYNDIRNLIDEYNLKWDDRFIDRFSLEALFSEPIEIITGRIKSQLYP